MARLSPTLMAVWRLLPPWSPAKGGHDLMSLCWRKVVFNLKAIERFRRPFSSDAVCSRRCTPSGLVPGGAAIDRDRMHKREIGGEGARRRPRLD
jgi:hypothetical protein